ncbi:hypothetical protein, conserved [Eimeria praecox]|uniref:Transmembrane protein n=1 Tax=Eimeria praecox TaxID=51316 RepID=U6GUD2_9EIME|nr:hypothetical protein, conserved [Eimeria praecox]
MGTRCQPPVTTEPHANHHQHLGLSLGGGDIGHPYSSSFDEDTDEEIFDRPLQQYDAFVCDPPTLQSRPALAEAGPRVYYASPLGESNHRGNLNGVSSLHGATREGSHLTASNSNRHSEVPTTHHAKGLLGLHSERRGGDDDKVKYSLEETNRGGGDVSVSQQQRETQDSTAAGGSPFVAVDMRGAEKKRLNFGHFANSECAEDTRFDDRGRGKQKWSKMYNENRNEAEQIAEEAFSKVKFWREVFSALTGMHGVYVLANFAFDNPAGGICSLFCFLCSAFAQVDRRAPSYFLTALLSFCFGIVVAVSLGTPVRGFEAFSTNLLLRRISITQACLLLLATPVAILVALRIIELHSFLREPGVLIPLDYPEETTEREQTKTQDASSNASEQHTNNDPNNRRQVTACGSQEEDAASKRRPSFESNQANT